MAVKAAVKRKLEAKAVSKSKKLKKQAEPESEEEVESSENEIESSEDELDESSDNEIDESSEDEDEDMEEGEDEEGDEEKNEQDAEAKAASRAEQKRLKQERKLARPQGEKLQQIKQLWERLRVKKDTPGPVRTKLVNEIWGLVEDSIKDMVFKHDASRVIQTIFKYADKEKRIKITQALKGSYVELAKSSYGKYLLVKLMHYGSQQVRADVINELYGSFRKLMRHKEGAYVIEDCYRDYSTAAQKRQIIREFYGSEFAVFKDAADKNMTLKDIITANPDKRPYLMRNLGETIKAAVQKGSIGFTIIHAAMLEYVKNMNSKEKEEFVDLVTEQFAEIVHTNEGSQVASRVLAMATAKERKNLVRALKAFASKCSEDEYGYFVMITLFNTVDDTVLVSKAFMPDFKENVVELMKSKMGRRPFIYLLAGRAPRYFQKPVQDKFDEVDELKKETSKKDDEARRTELRKAFAPLFMDAIKEHTEELLQDNLGAQFISEALLFCADGDREGAVDAIISLLSSGSVSSDEHILKQQPFAQRMLKTLIQEGVWNGKEKKVEKAPSAIDFKSKLLPLVIEDPEAWATGEGSFVVVALLESLEKADKTKLAKALKKANKEIKAVAAENKGSKLILELL
ncbi:pumilio homology domain family member 6 [Trichomonascus vanleenenianus]|uniref:Puf6p n=1 Tax=Trichomonascus vanleenenianus TaxID=2268995 RepID=UPI003ECAA83D